MRRAARARGEAARAVHPGLRGGRYRPLGDDDIRRIHAAALDVLENIGIGDPIAEILHYALPGGCVLGEDNRLRFPRALVEDLIARSAREYPLYAPDPRHDRIVRGREVLFCTSGEAVTILDYETQKFRPTRLTDLYDAARLADQLEHIHNVGQPFIAAEYSDDLFVHDVNIAYAELAGTGKSFALGIATADHIEPLIALFDAYLDQDGGFLKRPFCTFGGCPIVSPLRFGKDNAEVLVKLAELGLVAAYPGIVGSLMGQSFEGMVIDNDMIGNIQRVLRGIEVTDETLSYDVINDAVFGSGHFLGHEQTLDLMQSEYLYPEIADRLTPGAWEELGSKTLYEQAHERVGEMLAGYYPTHIDPAADERIRDRFPIRLQPEDMKPGNGRW